MRKEFLAGLLTGIFFMSGAGFAQANLLSNGDFDQLDHRMGNVNGEYLDTLLDGEWDVFDSLPGDWLSGTGAGIEIQRESVVRADSGDYYVELDSHGSDPTNSSMYQEIFLDEGQYELSFMYHARTRTNNDNGIEGLLDGVSFGSINWVSGNHGQGNPWQQVSWTLSVASAGLHQVGFGAFGRDNTLGGFVDSASLVAAPVPEPATMLLFGAGIAGLVGTRLRKKK